MGNELINSIKWMRKNNTNEAKQKKKERESSESGGGKEQFASNDTKNKNARIVRNYKYIIIIIIIKRNPLHIKCYRVSELRPNAKYDFVAYITHVHTHTLTHSTAATKQQQPRNRQKHQTEPTETHMEYFILYHKPCSKRIPFSNCHSNCTWFACFARIIPFDEVD